MGNDNESDGSVNSDVGEEIDSVEILGTPCPSDPQHLTLFQIALQQSQLEDIIPGNYGILEEQWGEDEYPTIETIQSVQCGCREVMVELPNSI